jgi:hypothetical protein
MTAHSPEHLWAKLLDLWAIRKCFICSQYGACSHREPEVDMAVLEAYARRRILQERQLGQLRISGRKGPARIERLRNSDHKVLQMAGSNGRISGRERGRIATRQQRR